MSLIYGRTLLNVNEDEFDCFECTAEIFFILSNVYSQNEWMKMNENEWKNENKKNKELWIENNIAMHKQYNYKNLKTCMRLMKRIAILILKRILIHEAQCFYM